MFRSRETGRVVIAQFPNVPLWIFLGTVVVRAFVETGAPRTAVDWVAALSLGVWALDEVVRGVNPWRRVLGAGGGVFAVAGIVALVR